MAITAIANDAIMREAVNAASLFPNKANGAAAADKTADGESFKSLFDSYIGLLNDANALQLDAEELQLDYASGRTDDMLSVMMAQEKAYTSLNFTVQVTNKIIEAYREIMRIQM